MLDYGFVVVTGGGLWPEKLTPMGRAVARGSEIIWFGGLGVRFMIGGAETGETFAR